MEWEIFKALNWKLHPPTLFAFISHLLMVFPQEAHHSVRKEVFEVAIYMAELSVCDSSYVRFSASTVAMAAILNVMDDLPLSRLSKGARETFWRDVNYSTSFRESPALRCTRQRLKILFNATVNTMKDNMDQTVEPTVTSSPTSTIDPMQVDENGSITSSTGSMKYNGHTYAKNDRYRYSPSPIIRSSSPVVRSSIGPLPMQVNSNRIVSSSPIVGSIR
jgi:hypothetical protein